MWSQKTSARLPGRLRSSPPPKAELRSPGQAPWQRPGIPPGHARRILDVALAAGVLALTVPLLLVLAGAARISTGGTAIYRQRRVGQGGIPFTLYKFRTMRPGLSGPQVTAPGDQRVTRLGALLRRTSLDELPQMVNVLLGDMTLVGPRPESAALASRYPQEFAFVFQYRPGVTGPSQVLVRDEKVLGDAADPEGFYLSKLVPHRVATDMSYLRQPSLSSTVRWLVSTALYLVGVTKPRLAVGSGATGGTATEELGRASAIPDQVDSFGEPGSAGGTSYWKVTASASQVPLAGLR